MKLVSMLAVASLLASGAAFAADAPAAGSAAAPSTSAPSKHPSLKHCRKEATEKGLKGKEKTAFVKDCHAGKSM